MGRRERGPGGEGLLIYCPSKEPPMIASDVHQKIDTLADQITNLRGYL
jgi:hypothetical protein